jgi:CHAT domain-containing protein
LRQQYDLALPHLQRALELVPLHRDSAAQTVQTHHAARELYEQNEAYDLALEHAKILTSIYAVDGVNNQIDLARNYHKMGNFYRAKRDLQQAMAHYERAFQNYQLAPKTTVFDRANIHRSLALAAADLQQVERQQQHLDQALELVRDVPTARAAALYTTLLKDLGDYYFQRRQAREAIASYHAYLDATLQQHGPQTLAAGIAYTNIALAYARGNNLAAAEQYLEQAIAIKLRVHGRHHPSVAVAYGNLALLLQKMGRYQAAAAKSFQSFKANTADYEGKNATVPLTPIVQQTGILQPITAINNLSTRATAYYQLYQKEKKLKWLRLAQESVLAQLAIFDTHKMRLTDVEKINLLQKNFLPFNLGVELSALLYQKTKEIRYLEEGFELAERAKDARLTNTLSNGKTLHYGGIPDSLRLVEVQLRQRMAAIDRRILDVERGNNLLNDLEGQLLALSERHRLLLLELEREYPDYYTLAYNQEVATIKNLQINVLEENETALAYYIPYPKAYVWTIKKGNAQLHTLELDSSYQQKVHAFRRAIATPNTAIPSELAQYFYRTFVAPDLDGAPPTGLYILPDHWLCHLPFEVFETAPMRTNAAQRAYLLEQSAISYAYSASLLLLNKQQQFARNRPLLFLGAAPSYGGATATDLGTARSDEDLLMRQYLTPLPYVREELQGLEQDRLGVFLYDNRATEVAFKRNIEEYGIIHLGAHALLNPVQPIRSAIAFAESTDLGEDNFLSLAEISDLPLRAQLVSLTACQTGYGKFEHGEGLAALTRSFMYAGAPAVLANLWSVNASSSSVLMSAFYAQLQLGKHKGEALRQAKLNYLKEVATEARHPYYWAAFVLYGNADPLDLSKNGWFTLSNIFLAVFTLLLLIIMLSAIRRRHRRRLPTTYDFD